MQIKVKKICVLVSLQLFIIRHSSNLYGNNYKYNSLSDSIIRYSSYNLFVSANFYSLILTTFEHSTCLNSILTQLFIIC